MLRQISKACLALVMVGGAACHEPGVKWTQTVEPITIETPSASTSEVTPAVIQFFGSRCAPCHGSEGHGDGIAAASLNPHPRNFHDTAWQASHTDAQIDHVIRDGGEAVGRSPLMPANPDLADRPQFIAALRTYIRSFNTEPPRTALR